MTIGSTFRLLVVTSRRTVHTSWCCCHRSNVPKVGTHAQVHCWTSAHTLTIVSTTVSGVQAFGLHLVETLRRQRDGAPGLGFTLGSVVKPHVSVIKITYEQAGGRPLCQHTTHFNGEFLRYQCNVWVFHQTERLPGLQAK